MTLNILLMVMDLLLLAGGVILTHCLRRRYGLAPLLLYLAGIVALLHASGPIALFIEPMAGLRLDFGAFVLVPPILLGLMILYATEGTATARVAIASILGASALVLGIQLVQSIHAQLPGTGVVSGLAVESPLFRRSLRITFSSLMAFGASLTTAVIVFQGTRNRMRRDLYWAAPGLALLFAALVDTLVFRAISIGWGGLSSGLFAAMTGKVGAMLLLWPMAAWYLMRLSRTAPPTGDVGRGAFDILFGKYAEQEAALRLTEARRKDVEAKLQAVVSGTPLVILAIDPHGTVTLSEGAGLDSLGLKPGQLVGQSVFEVLPELGDDLRRALKGESFSAIQSVRDAVFETTFTPLVGPDGSIRGVTGVALDLTEKVKAQRALQESEERFRDTFEKAGVGIIHWRPDGRFLRVNRTFLDMLDFEESDLEGQTVWDIIHASDRDQGRQQSDLLLQGEGDAYTSERRLVKKDGSRLSVRLTVSLIPGENGEHGYLISIVEDITDRKTTEDLLRQAQKMEAVGQLTGGVAHDFNNLLTVIMGGLELGLAEVERRSETHEALETAFEAAQRGAALTQRLLAFSRKQALRPISIDLRVLLEEMRRLLEATMGETIDVHIHVDSDVQGCVADRIQMENAILNLALNARDAQPEGGSLIITASNVQLDAEYAASEGIQPGPYVLLNVEDQGLGMSKEATERAFEPFFTTKDVGKGSGLGLSMVYGFVGQSGGHVTLASTPGAGTTVSLYLPPSKAPPAAAMPERGRSPAFPAQVGVRPAAGRMILVVEDDPDVRRLMVRMLRGLGYQVVEADRGSEALERLEAEPDLVLVVTDVILPGGMTGADLGRKVAVLRPDLPVVYTSGYSEDALIHQGRLDEGIQLLEKPFQQDDLEAVIVNALRNHTRP